MRAFDPLSVCVVLAQVADQRLRKNAEFQRVRQEGRSWSNRWLVLSVAANGLPSTRVGYVLGKRLGGAVVRNRLKRQLRELLRLRLAAAKIRPGYDLVFIGRVPLAEADWTQMGKAVDDLLRRANLG